MAKALSTRNHSERTPSSVLTLADTPPWNCRNTESMLTRDAEMLEDSSQEGEVDRERGIRCREVDSGHAKRDSLSLLHFLRSFYHQHHHVDARASSAGSRSALLAVVPPSASRQSLRQRAISSRRRARFQHGPVRRCPCTVITADPSSCCVVL